MIESGSPILFAVKTISDSLFQGLRYVKLKAESLLDVTENVKILPKRQSSKINSEFVHSMAASMMSSDRQELDECFER